MKKSKVKIEYHNTVIVGGLNYTKITLLINALHALQKDIKCELKKGKVIINYENDKLHDSVNSVIKDYAE